MKGHRGEGIKPSQAKGGSASGDREPLFPRLHVNETEKAGPKAPPRNKMALYEQFTVPSHRFVQPTQASPTPSFQQPYGSGYPYTPYCIPSVPYANASNNVQAYSQPSQVTSSSGITSGSAAASERHHKVGNSSRHTVSRGLGEARADCIMNGLSEQKGKGAKIFCGSSFTNDIGESTKFLGNILPGKETPYTSDRTESLHEAISTLEEGMEDTHHRCDVRVDGISDDERSEHLTGDVSTPFPLNLSETSTKPTRLGVIDKSPTGSTCKRDLVTQALTAHGHCPLQSGTFFEPRRSEGRAILVAEGQSVLPMKGRAQESLRYDALHGSLPEVKKGDISKVAVLDKSDIKSLEELKTFQYKVCELSQPVCSGGLPENLADLAPVIKPKDVILAMGQQQFWKARKTLLRQQRIFSDQVYQLHKIITVQQLLAGTPGTSIDKAVHFETVEECDAGAPISKGTVSIGDCARNTSDLKKGSKGDAEGPRADKKNVRKEASMPDLTYDGVSAWGYPSFGQWIGGPMAPQGQPNGYQLLPPGSAFGLPYGYALSGPASPMVSFGIPYCGQRQELPTEMGSNYGLATGSKYEGRGFASRNFDHFSNHLAGSWHFMQQNNLNHQRMHSDGSGKDAPTGSGASVNKGPATAVQGVKTTCFPGLVYQWGLNSQAGPSNTEGLENSGQQSEISSPTRLNTSATLLKPSLPAAKGAGLSHKEVQGLVQNLGMASVHLSNSPDSRSSVGKEEADARACSKVQKEGGSSPVDDGLVGGNVHSSHLGFCALELFPLMPSLSPSGRNGQQDSRASEGGQGHVIRVVPRRATAASESAAGILLSLQQERQK